MPQPFNYTLDVKNPFEIAASGMQAGASIADAMRKKQQAEQEQERTKLINDHISQLQLNKDATAEDYAKLAMMLPKDQAESVQKAWGMIEKAKLDEEIGRKGTILSALVSGNNDLAVEKMNEYATAYRNSGKEGPAKYYETWAKVAEQNPDAARVNFGMMLTTMPGGDKMIEGITKLAESRRSEELHDPEAAKAKTQAELDAKAAELGLTNAQKNKVMVETKKLNAETAKIYMDLENSKKTGGVDPEKRFEFEDKLRKEYNALTQPARQVQSAYQRIVDAEETAAGDIALIFNYMKMLDPGSVVREGEFATAQNAAGIPVRVQNMYNKALEGTRLAPDQRKQFASQAGKLFEGSKRQEEEIRKGMSRAADDYGLKKENIFYAPGGLAAPVPSPAPVAAPGAAPTAAPAGVSQKTIDILNKYPPKQ